MRNRNRITAAYDAWDSFVAQAAAEDIPVDTTLMTDALSRDHRRVKRWELLRVGGA